MTLGYPKMYNVVSGAQTLSFNFIIMCGKESRYTALNKCLYYATKNVACVGILLCYVDCTVDCRLLDTKTSASKITWTNHICW